MKISNLRTFFHIRLASLYDERERDAVFYLYIENKYDIKKHRFFLNPELEIEFYKDDIEALARGCPIQYITGETTFYELPVKVNPSVLIPRPETEELVELILNLEKQRKGEKEKRRKGEKEKKILDLCTGSGAIALALAKNIENASVWACDHSKAALKTARINAKLNQIKINFFLYDILKEDIGILPDNIDFIVSNPPYIPISERKIMHKNVRNFEPETALFVPDENPLVFYIAIAAIAKKILRYGGSLFLETHEKFHLELSEILGNNYFSEIKRWKDLNGKPRFISCKKL